MILQLKQHFPCRTAALSLEAVPDKLDPECSWYLQDLITVRRKQKKSMNTVVGGNCDRVSRVRLTRLSTSLHSKIYVFSSTFLKSCDTIPVSSKEPRISTGILYVCFVNVDKSASECTFSKRILKHIYLCFSLILNADCSGCWTAFLQSLFRLKICSVARRDWFCLLSADCLHR